MRIYLAAPLFTMAERHFNRALAAALTSRLPNTEIILPQDFRVGKFTSFNDRRHAAALYDACVEAVAKADAVLAVLDGADADSGVSFETGFARALGKPVIGLRTDFRQSQVKGVNIMLAEGCGEVVCHFSFNENLDDLADVLIPHIEKARPPKHDAPLA